MIKVQKVTNMSLKTAAQQKQTFHGIPGRRTDIRRQMLRLVNSVDQKVKTAEKKMYMCSHGQGNMINDDYETNYN